MIGNKKNRKIFSVKVEFILLVFVMHMLGLIKRCQLLINTGVKFWFGNGFHLMDKLEGINNKIKLRIEK